MFIPCCRLILLCLFATDLSCMSRTSTTKCLSCSTFKNRCTTSPLDSLFLCPLLQSSLVPTLQLVCMLCIFVLTEFQVYTWIAKVLYLLDRKNIFRDIFGVEGTYARVQIEAKQRCACRNWNDTCIGSSYLCNHNCEDSLHKSELFSDIIKLIGTTNNVMARMCFIN